MEASSIVRTGSLEDRTVVYRHDQFVAANPAAPRNPHSVWRFSLSATTIPIAVAVQQLFSDFFAGDGEAIPATSPYFETPMRNELPVDYDIIP